MPLPFCYKKKKIEEVFSDKIYHCYNSPNKKYQNLRRFFVAGEC